MSNFMLLAAPRSIAHRPPIRLSRPSRRALMTLPAFSLEGKTCIVTGAARGLGEEFLTAFALSGARGACIDLSFEAGEQSIKHISEYISSQPSTASTCKPEWRVYACDVTSEAHMGDTWDSIVQDSGQVDVVVTAAGIVENFEGEKYPFDRWRKIFDVDVHRSYLFARAAGRYWIENRRKGNLILVSSMSAQVCVRPPRFASGPRSKRCTMRLATEWGSRNIRVNSQCPGYMRTDLIRDLLEKEGKHIEEGWAKEFLRAVSPIQMEGTHAGEGDAFRGFQLGGRDQQTFTLISHRDIHRTSF
ncbi:sorbose reductase SOU1 [Drepanopeziza brunnea f. sp. 'multigermtubi' MB_m1]|uniref:Sorbose reductase SOU1 n=1 Tax=Marssonina brunnea f. sp. multigermtubi (strain MB_m1) TaxID=1072389 RepID=K1XM13_MARBU|nr:sorbose reductase SOU1 [Drepanopeziza brunnea f. sp. 'multigermtubi' MB_m1]EKD21568.1 sorbose reductase SOU1 [Drepanopeziza brunnea f. sp. 'multigermtubi' MB_m1]